MKILQSCSDVVYVQPKFLTKKECNYYLKKAISPTSMERQSYAEDRNISGSFWHKRRVDITFDPIVRRVKKFLDKQFNLDLKIGEAQIQTWIQNSCSELHIHDEGGRENTVFNSSIYLNDDFSGGKFFTKNGIKIKPTVGLLIFFNGRTIFHGVSEVKKKDRFSLIFWWKN